MEDKGKALKIGIVLLVILVIGIFIALSSSKINAKKATYGVVPIPSELKGGNGSYILEESTNIYVLGKSEEETEEIYKVGEKLSEVLRKSTGYRFNIYKEDGASKKGIFLTTKEEETSFENEGYKLKISEEGVKISGNKAEGVFRGVQTLRQLLPPEIEKDVLVSDIKWNVPFVDILDKPRYEYRGIMIDVARHFFPVEEIKRQIDLASYYKINKLHLHLSDDQGWRLEIKKWPELTKIGGSTEVGGGSGGYYTQADFSEIVSYAKERYMEVIPEIDMPGHTNAALASLDFLNKDGVKKPLYIGREVGFSALMCRDEKTYSFIEDVIGEIAKLSPSKYIHIGGDEANTLSKEDYHYFMARVSKIVESYGKTPIAWDPADGSKDISDNTVIQNWKSSATNGKSRGMKLIVSKAERCYLDMMYSSSSTYGLNWAGYIPIRASYEWDTTDYASEDLTLGIEAPLWTETIGDRKGLDYMIYPRLLSYAEIGWSENREKGFEEFWGRLILQEERMKSLGIDYYRDKVIFKDNK